MIRREFLRRMRNVALAGMLGEFLLRSVPEAPVLDPMTELWNEALPSVIAEIEEWKKIILEHAGNEPNRLIVSRDVWNELKARVPIDEHTPPGEMVLNGLQVSKYIPDGHYGKIPLGDG